MFKTPNPLYGEIITALGFSGQISYRTRTDMRFLQSADLRLYQNKPEMMKDGYITHTDVDGFGALFQAEVNSLQHNLLDPLNQESTTIESALAADVQARVGFNTTFLEVDLVYKDLAYILFNVPGLTSGLPWIRTCHKPPKSLARQCHITRRHPCHPDWCRLDAASHL